MRYFSLVILFIVAFGYSYAQDPEVILRPGQIGNPAVPGNKTGVSPQSQSNKDSLALGFLHRDDSKDSISLTYRALDSVRNGRMDSSVNDFDRYFPVPSSWQYLGNNGAAAYPFLYAPYNKPGWDAGFHAFDIYRFKLEDTRFYKTNRPFTQLGYQLASGKEQMIKVFHTQNPRPNWNFGLDYRLISAPGFFISQNANHKSYRIFSNYQGIRKRYAAYLTLMGNTIKNSENAGIVNDSSLSDPDKKERFSVDVNLGNGSSYTRNPFNTTVNTGNIYKDLTFFLRQSYDIGKKDSVAINDSTTEYLFYPKLRIQHTFTYSTYIYQFIDLVPIGAYAERSAKIDSAFFQDRYDTTVAAEAGTLLTAYEKWKVIGNDLSLLQFPDTKNSAQFLLAGIKLENIQGQLKNGSTNNFYNVVLHGEYRNKTRNKLWDLILKGEFYSVGLNSGNYNAYASIGRFLNKKLGNIRLFFNNVNRTPSFIYNDRSAFNFGNATLSKNENIITFGAEANNSFVNLGFKNHTITNLAYFSDLYHTTQSSKVVNVVQLYASKKLRLAKRWNLYLDAILQQTDVNGPVKVPLLFTRSRLAYEGNFFKNLNISTGLEIRYYTAYKGYDYSPVMGQFVPQDTVRINNLPDVAAFLHFRIKGFTAYIRAENLNTVSFSDGFTFTNNNFAAPHYPTQGFIFRFGIQWNFVN